VHLYTTAVTVTCGPAKSCVTAVFMIVPATPTAILLNRSHSAATAAAQQARAAPCTADPSTSAPQPAPGCCAATTASCSSGSRALKHLMVVQCDPAGGGMIMAAAFLTATAMLARASHMGDSGGGALLRSSCQEVAMAASKLPLGTKSLCHSVSSVASSCRSGAYPGSSCRAPDGTLMQGRVPTRASQQHQQVFAFRHMPSTHITAQVSEAALQATIASSG
jgi:hypothetical protein